MIEIIILRSLVVLIGIIYPAIGSYKAFRSKEMEVYKRWLMYWPLFALCSLIDSLVGIFVTEPPFYYETKLAILVFLLNPLVNGTSLLYYKVNFFK